MKSGQGIANGWETVKQKPQRKSKEPRLYVSLNKRGEIVLNQGAWKCLGDTASVTLLFDAASGRIGVKYPVALDRHFFSLRRYGRGRRLRIVQAARLLKQFEIAISRTTVFCNIKAVNYNGQPMLMLDLNDTRFARGNHDEVTIAAAASI